MRVLTLSLLKFLENNGLGTIDENLFWEKLGIGRDGLYITDLGDTQSRIRQSSSTYRIYSRAKDDLKAFSQLQKVFDLLRASYGQCKLPAVPPYTDEGFDRVTILPPSAISNDGVDTNGNTIFSITGRTLYNGHLPTSPPPRDKDIILTENENAILTELNQPILTE